MSKCLWQKWIDIQPQITVKSWVIYWQNLALRFVGAINGAASRTLLLTATTLGTWLVCVRHRHAQINNVPDIFVEIP